MSRGIHLEIKQKKPFQSLEQELFLNLIRTADILQRHVFQALKPASLSPAQYNVLRILRGAGKDGLPCGEIGERMVTHDPDITRLVDRLEKRGLVTRSRESGDRRVVTVRIAREGLMTLEALDKPLNDLQRSLLGSLDRGSQERLIKLLEKTREGVSVSSRND